MMILGVATLGNLNAPTMSQDDLGLAFWRIVISAGVLGMVMSLVNLLAVSPALFLFQISKSTRTPLIKLLSPCVDNHFHQFRCRYQRTPYPCIWRSRSATGSESDQQPSLIPAQLEA